MFSILLAAHALDGHTGPMLPLAQHLADAGHRVRFLSGERFAERIRRAGAEFVPWPRDACADHEGHLRTIEAEGRRNRGVRQLARDVEVEFLAPGPGQYRAIRSAIAAEPVDAVIAENMVVGATLLARDPKPHPPVIMCGISVLGFTSPDAPPVFLGLQPRDDWLGRARNRLLYTLIQKVLLRHPQRVAERIRHDVIGLDTGVFFMDSARFADRYAQFTVPGFEYPRHDLPPNVVFTGPMLGLPARAGELPPWWGDLDGRTVVHVSQGTLANTNPEELLGPTLRALADRDLLVVATTGGLPVESLGTLPRNARAAEFIPHDALMPRTSVFVTNGGYGGVHAALARGVPLVVAGDTEDKKDVAARIAWSGVGINLRTGLPGESSIADAVETVLQTPSYRERAEAIAAEIAASPGAAGVERMIAETAAAGRGPEDAITSLDEP
ncbi:nucleotide disphospho-sugar-binding domain-containing protein [Agromyces sp. S2-1-8]|uniref:nucleotide disphospho-sugar-binding domain-containing protein n=1 Tax=Agromyces TaxID=33877 RepID=UPI0035ABBC50